jgi:hypothetical protein
MFKKAAILAIGLAVALSAETVVKGVKIRFNRSDHTGDWWTKALI